MISKDHVKQKPDKEEAVKCAKRPNTKTQVCSLLDLAGYYRKFIANFAAIACPLLDLIEKGQPNMLI